jgi:hypothetical protein
LIETKVNCVVAFLPEISDVENPSKVSFFPQTLDLVFIFLQTNHGHGGHESGVRRGVFGDGLPKKKYPQGVAGPLFEKTPVFGVRLPKLDQLTVID